MYPVHPSAAIRFERLGWRPPAGLGGRCATGLMTGFLLFSPYLANVSRDYTRLCCFWTVRDSLELIALVLAVTAALIVFGEVVAHTRSVRLVRIQQHALVLLLGIGVLSNLVFAGRRLPGGGWTASSPQMVAALVLLVAVSTYAFFNTRSRLVPRLTTLCRITAPIVPVTLAGVLLQASYSQPLEPFTPPPPTHVALTGSARMGSGGVYVFLFDEWSYERTFADGNVLAPYPNLAALASIATTYHDAHAPGTRTEQSIPAILYQTDAEASVEHGKFGFRTSGGFVATGDLTHLFNRLSVFGFHDAVIGFGLPYRSWLGGEVELCRSYCYYPLGEDWLTRTGRHLFNVWYYSPEPWSGNIRKKREESLVHGQIRSILENSRRDVHTIIREWPRRTFLFAHLHLPHMPALLNADLTVRPVRRTLWGDNDARGYEANLAAMDATVGEIVQALREAGKFDDSVIVLTSDHGWRHDPTRATDSTEPPLTHVPLLVKAPGQTRPRSVHDRFETRCLGGLLDSMLSSPAPDALVTGRIRP